MNSVLRSVTTYATLTEAVLETRAVRLVDPRAPSAALVKALARQLWSAGLRVSFGPSWAPVPDADVSVGTRGLEDDGVEDAFEAFLRMHPAWRPQWW